MLGKTVLRVMLCVFGMLLFGRVVVQAQEGDPPPIIVQTEVNSSAGEVQGGIQPNAVVSKGSWVVTIQNAVYKLSNKVESDGWAPANFNQPGTSVIYCEARVINEGSGGREVGVSYPPYVFSAPGGNHCGTTPRAWRPYPRFPYYTGQTYAQWRWPDWELVDYTLDNGPHQW